MGNTYQLCKKPNTRSNLVWLAGLCVIVAALLYASRHLLSIAVVNGDSMYPTMENGKFLLVDRIHSMYSRGDIILAQVPTMNSGGEYIVKRVIAVGGETLSIDYEKNEVTVDGELISEPYINLEEDDPMWPENDVDTIEYLVPDGYIFVMGDNRNYSADSRSEEIGPISEKKIIGKVINP